MLAAKCGDAVAGKLIDQDGNVVTGNTAAVATWTAPNTEVDTQKYRNSRYNSDVEVTNTFDDADVNYWANDDEKSPTCPAARGIRPTPPRWRP